LLSLFVVPEEKTEENGFYVKTYKLKGVRDGELGVINNPRLLFYSYY